MTSAGMKSQKKSVKFANEEEAPIRVSLDDSLNPIIETSAEKVIDSAAKSEADKHFARKVSPKEFVAD